jgi:FAD/FMN-containing dehydrogenase
MGAHPVRRAMTRSAPDWAALQSAIAGDVVLPSSPEYEQVRKPAIARFDDVRPQAVVLCRTPADVSETILLARRFGLHVAARSGGHCFAGRSSTRGILIDVTPMRSVTVSGAVATVGAGARLGDIYDSLEEHDRTISAGCGPSVGIAGLALGGGLGILGRKHGLTADHLLGAQVVLADGRVVDCDDGHDAELLWALRGAGSNFGVVTSLVLATVPAPAATSFHLVWPQTHAAAVIDAWQAWAPTAPEELAASLLVTAAGDRPGVVNMFGAMLGSESDTGELLQQLVARAGTDPISASRRHTSHRETKRYLAELGDTMAGDQLEAPSHDQPSQQIFPYIKSEFFKRLLPAKAVATLVENFFEGLVPGRSRELDFTPWGGAYNRVRGDATAFVHRDELFLLKHSVVVDRDASTHERESARRWLARSWATVHPWGSGGVYQNFPDPDLEDGARAYYGDNYDRLRRIKEKYDPDDFFRFHQSISNQPRGAIS